MLTFIGEFIGMTLLVGLGNGCVANNLIKKSKGADTGWLLITIGWGFAVTFAVYVSGWMSGAHLNPAVTFSLLYKGMITWSQVPEYLLGQFLGAFFGAFLVWVIYQPLWKEKLPEQKRILCYATMPAVKSRGWNFITEFLCTAVLMIGVERVVQEFGGMQSAGAALLIGSIVFLIGLCFGGPTGYAINPARDFSPRLFYTLFKIGPRKSAGWDYAFVPFLAPLLGGIFGTWAYSAVSSFFSR